MSNVKFYRGNIEDFVPAEADPDGIYFLGRSESETEENSSESE